MSFISEEDKAARAAAQDSAADSREVGITAAVDRRLPAALRMVKRDHNAGKAVSIIAAANWGNLIAWDIAKRLSELITEETGFPAEPSSNAVDMIHEVRVTLPN